MGKVIKLTEADLERIVKQVIEEQETQEGVFDPLVNAIMTAINFFVTLTMEFQFIFFQKYLKKTLAILFLLYLLLSVILNTII